MIREHILYTAACDHDDCGEVLASCEGFDALFRSPEAARESVAAHAADPDGLWWTDGGLILCWQHRPETTVAPVAGMCMCGHHRTRHIAGSGACQDVPVHVDWSCKCPDFRPDPTVLSGQTQIGEGAP